MSRKKEFGIINRIGEKVILRVNYNPYHFEENIHPKLSEMGIKDFNYWRTITSKQQEKMRFECICSQEQLHKLMCITIEKNIKTLQERLALLTY